MFTVIALMLTGILAGLLLRHRKSGGVRHFITVLIWVLLFLLGVEVGGNERIIRGLHTLGLEALAIAAASTLGSVLVAWSVWRWAEGRNKKEGKKEERA